MEGTTSPAPEDAKPACRHRWFGLKRSTGSGRLANIMSQTASQGKQHRGEHAEAERAPPYSDWPLGGSIPCPWHSSHFPEPWQTPQTTLRFDLNHPCRGSHLPFPSHLLQRPVPLQKGQALRSPSKAILHAPRLFHYAPSGNLATRFAVNARPEHQPADDNGVYASSDQEMWERVRGLSC